jgi:hypothetical protein
MADDIVTILPLNMKLWGNGEPMSADHLKSLGKFEANLWKVADDLRANSGLASNEYFMPILGLIFLRYATNRFHEAKAAIDADTPSVRCHRPRSTVKSVSGAAQQPRTLGDVGRDIASFAEPDFVGSWPIADTPVSECRGSHRGQSGRASG